MSEYSDAGPVGRLLRIGKGIAVFHDTVDEFVHQVRVRAAMSGTLEKGQVLVIVCIIHASGGKWLDFLRQKLCRIRNFYTLSLFTTE